MCRWFKNKDRSWRRLRLMWKVRIWILLEFTSSPCSFCLKTYQGSRSVSRLWSNRTSTQSTTFHPTEMFTSTTKNYPMKWSTSKKEKLVKDLSATHWTSPMYCSSDNSWRTQKWRKKNLTRKNNSIKITIKKLTISSWEWPLKKFLIDLKKWL